MRPWRISSGGGGLARFLTVALLGSWMSVTPVSAAMAAHEIGLACNSLARMAFDLKDLINVVATLRNPGPFQVRLSWKFGSTSSPLSVLPVPVSENQTHISK